MGINVSEERTASICTEDLACRRRQQCDTSLQKYREFSWKPKPSYTGSLWSWHFLTQL